jgi:hypothetical protein
VPSLPSEKHSFAKRNRIVHPEAVAGKADLAVDVEVRKVARTVVGNAVVAKILPRSLAVAPDVVVKVARLVVARLVAAHLAVGKVVLLAENRRADQVVDQDALTPAEDVADDGTESLRLTTWLGKRKKSNSLTK